MFTKGNLVSLMLSISIPLFSMGDDFDFYEYGQTNQAVNIEPIEIGQIENQPLSPISLSTNNIVQVTAIAPITPVAMPSIQDIESLSMATGVSVQEIQNIFELTSEKGIPIAITESAIVHAISNNLDIIIVPDIAGIAYASHVDVQAIAEICALASQQGMTELTLVDIAQIAKANGISVAVLKDILELKKVSQTLKSRFDMLNPTTFSNLWMIKMKGKDMEARGKNTDELWKQYWDLFYKAAMQGL